MSLEHCPACTTAYSIGAPHCPHCQHLTGAPVPKSFVIGPPSYAGHEDVSPHDVSEPDWQPPIAEAVLPSPQAQDEPPAAKPAPRKRARRS